MYLYVLNEIYMYVCIYLLYLPIFISINQQWIDSSSVSVGILGAFALGPRALKAKTKENKTKKETPTLL